MYTEPNAVRGEQMAYHATEASGSAGSAPAKSGRHGTSQTHSVPIRGYAR
jgi:hypothetical protein